MKKSIFFEHIIAASHQEQTDVTEMMDYVASIGYVGCDMGWESPKQLKAQAQTLSSHGLAVSSVYRFWDYTTPLDKNDASTFFSSLKEVGTTQAMVIPMGGKAPYEEQDYTHLYAWLSELCSIAVLYGIDVSVEDFDDTGAIINHTASLSRLFCHVPAMRHTFDTGNYPYFYESPLDALYVFIDKITHVHLKDRSYTPPTQNQPAGQMADGAPVYPCANGEGFVPLKDIILRLKAHGYQGYLSVEHFGHKEMKNAIKRSAHFIDTVLSDLS